MRDIMTACTYIEKIVGGHDLDWPGTPMLTVKQKYNTDVFDYVSVSFASPKVSHFDAPWDLAGSCGEQR
jgi:hypothetical protein